MKFVVTVVGHATVTGPEGPLTVEEASEPLEHHLDGVMDELERVGAGDPSINLDLSSFLVEFSVLVDGNNPLEAATEAGRLLGSAIRAAGGETPDDWPNVPSDAWSVRLLSVHSDPMKEEETDDEEDDAYAALVDDSALAGV